MITARHGRSPNQLPSTLVSRHCNHHAFPTSARHGLEWWEFDLTWMVVCTLKALGLAWDVRVPSEKEKALRRVKGEYEEDEEALSAKGAKAGKPALAAAGKASPSKKPAGKTSTGGAAARTSTGGAHPRRSPRLTRKA